MMKTNFSSTPVKIKVIGLGYGGSWAVTCMVRAGINGVEFVAMDTDYCSLQLFEGSIRVLLGEGLTKGFGTNCNPNLGCKAAEKGRDVIREVIRGAEIVFIIVGMGGGAGSGSASVVAEVAKESGALTIGIVTKPFGIEGNHLAAIAEDGIKALTSLVDALIIIPNDRLFTLSDQKFIDLAFKRVSEFIVNALRAIVEPTTVPSIVNLDLADLRTIMKDAGPARISIGLGSGQNRAADAAKAALASPLLDVPLSAVKRVFFTVSGGESLSLFEVNQVAEIIRRAVNPDAKMKFGAVPDSQMDNNIKVTLIVTGFESVSMTGNKVEKTEIRGQLQELKNNSK